jgi:nicotinate phosphoribosyltransferase
MAFPSELESFRQLQRVLGESTVQLIDTYDTVEGARRAAQLGLPLWGVRIDSGDSLTLSRQVRVVLDEAGLRDAKIMASGDFDEYKIRDLVNAGAPIDAFGVGTHLATSGDAPFMNATYKMVELNIGGINRFTAKLSEDKISLPGSKQVFREPERDVIARSGECGKGEALLRPVIVGGRLIEPLPTVDEARCRAADAVARLSQSVRELEQAEAPPIVYSRELQALFDRTRRNLTS